MLQDIYRKYDSCQRCELSCTAKNLVFGTGNPNADILIVKEMPSEAEDMYNTYATSDLDFMLRIFTDVIATKRGRFTTKELREMFLGECFITSSIICRATITAGENKGSNREPKISEVKACRDRLYDTIYEVDPLIVLALGKSAAIGLSKRTSKLPQKIGTPSSLFSFEIPGRMDTSVVYPAIYTHDINYAERMGDYDDPNGVISQICRAFDTVWRIAEALRKEDK